MEIEFFKASELDSNIKATIHYNGKLGFNRNAEKKLNLENAKSILIGKGSDYEKEKILYLIAQEEIDPDGFAVLKSGDYYYANTKSLFDKLEEDYEKYKVIYNITETTYNGKTIFKLKRRVIERKKGEESIEE
jgi:hypothetical protein